MINQKTLDDPQYAKLETLALTFQRTGRIGFWSQFWLATFPIAAMVFVLFFAGSLAGTRSGSRLIEWLTYGNILVLIFTTWWFSRYRRLGKEIGDPATRPTQEVVVGKVWTGLVASTLGIAFSILVMLFDVGQIFFYFLTAPQGGVPTVQMGGGTFVSAIDMASLFALVLVMAAEVLATLMGLWLLFRTSQAYSAAKLQPV
ncbi:MAG: DUF3611 family protein [Gammaproteobacteria bacterium]|jgi:hypothetical protein|nr:DUF3611 family protein [Candidatus Thioaporhodococcus sediminis]TNF55547.1 MAG: DUF3611 family protein [Gammaproteobacteria bacterium]